MQLNEPIIAEPQGAEMGQYERENQREKQEKLSIKIKT